MKSTRINVFITALMTTIAIVIVAQPNLIESQIAEHSEKILSSLNSK